MRLGALVSALAAMAMTASALSRGDTSSSTATVLTATAVRLHADVRCPARSCRYVFRLTSLGKPSFTSRVRRVRRGAHRVGLTVTGLERRSRYRFAVCVAPGRLDYSCYGPLGSGAGRLRTAACDRYAAPGGSDRRAGTLIAPLRTIVVLDARLRPGQIGCLDTGSYGDIDANQRLMTSGRPRARITLTGAPGQRPHLVGLLAIEGAYTTISGLDIDGSNRVADQTPDPSCHAPVSTGLEIDGRGDIFENNNYYQSIASLRATGIGVGWNSPADGAIIRNNRIHDLGQCQAYDQMIYLAHGDNVQIYDNWMWNDPHGWGVQIYPGAANAHVYSNVIDGAGSGFVISGGPAVRDNEIDHNIVLRPTGLVAAGLRRGVGLSTTGPIGPGNSFTDNIVFQAPGGIAHSSGVLLRGNRRSRPDLIDPNAHDYQLRR